MAGVLSLDIETSNYSYDIGGWDKTSMFEPTVVATYDGDKSTIFCNHDVDVEGADIRPLHPRDVGEHIMAHINAGGAIVGHNILRFDLPVLRDALDCHDAGVVLRKHKDSIIDTSQHLRKATTKIGNQFFIKLDDVCKHTLQRGKTMKSVDAPVQWGQGNHTEVAKYCLSDAMLNWELWLHGVETGIVKSRSRWTGEIVKLEVDWKWEKEETIIHKRHSN
tara:strand:+ start:247 stop:906 length:660 start_codon:yes stop_codon:yes gene_type:complete